MHTCPKCGAQFEGKFCPECGERYVETATCPNCGAPVVPDAKFCHECGHAYSAPVEPPAPQEEPAPIEPPAPQAAPIPYAPPTPQMAPMSAIPAQQTAPMPYVQPAQHMAPVLASVPKMKGMKKPYSEFTESERAVFLNSKVKRWRIHKTISFWSLWSIFPYTGSFLNPLIYLFTSWGRKTVDWNPGNLGKERKQMLGYTIANGILALAVFITLCVVSPILLGISELPDFAAPLIISLIGMIALMHIIGAVIGGTALPLGQELTILFYGRPDPIFEVDPPIITMPEVNRAMAVAVRTGEGASAKPAPDFYHIGAIGLSILYLIIAAIIVLTIAFGNKLTLENAQRIRFGESSYERWGHENVRDLFGDPYVEPGETLNDYRWEYFDGSYISLMDDYKALEEKAAEALMNGDFDKIESLEKDAEKIEAELSELEFTYLLVQFEEDETYGDFYVSSVLLDTSHHAMNVNVSGKSYLEAKFSKTTLYRLSDLETLELEVSYNDGSYWHVYVGDLLQFGEEDGSGRYSVSVTDPFGGTIKTTITLADGFSFDEN